MLADISSNLDASLSHYQDPLRQLKFPPEAMAIPFLLSMSRRVTCHDNVPMERLFRSITTERIPTVGYMSAALAKQDICWLLIERYNWWQPHQFNESLALAIAEKNLTQRPGSVDHYRGDLMACIIQADEISLKFSGGFHVIKLSLRPSHG